MGRFCKKYFSYKKEFYKCVKRGFVALIFLTNCILTNRIMPYILQADFHSVFEGLSRFNRPFYLSRLFVYIHPPCKLCPIHHRGCKSKFPHASSNPVCIDSYPQPSFPTGQKSANGGGVEFQILDDEGIVMSIAIWGDEGGKIPIGSIGMKLP